MPSPRSRAERAGAGAASTNSRSRSSTVLERWFAPTTQGCARPGEGRMASAVSGEAGGEIVQRHVLLLARSHVAQGNGVAREFVLADQHRRRRVDFVGPPHSFSEFSVRKGVV